MIIRKNNLAVRNMSLLLLTNIIFTQTADARAPSDWSKLADHHVKLFYPGQSSYQWLRSNEHKRANKKVAQGEACVSCHEGEESDIGELVVSGKRLEPHPISGKPAVIDLNVKVAYDTEHVFFQFKWPTANNFPGNAHPHWQYDGAHWKQIGWPRLHEKVWKEGRPAIYEDRFSMMLDDGSVPMFAEQGCWISCHNGMRDMPELASKESVNAHTFLGGTLHKKDVRKYLPGSRSDNNASWEKVKPVSEIERLKSESRFVDLMQWRAHRSQPIGMADDGYVFEYRLTDAGKNIFSKNWDKTLKQPKFMFDPVKVGFTSRNLGQIRDLSQPSSLIVEDNAVAFDASAKWKKGDMIPEYYVSRTMAKGSAADNSKVNATWVTGYWTLEWHRKLDTSHPADDKAFKKGRPYTFSFAVHDDNITTRGHHVSFPITIGFGVDADIQAVEIK
jgi:hypothetical protein